MRKFVHECTRAWLHVTIFKTPVFRLNCYDIIIVKEKQQTIVLFEVTMNKHLASYILLYQNFSTHHRHQSFCMSKTVLLAITTSVVIKFVRWFNKLMTSSHDRRSDIIWRQNCIGHSEIELAHQTHMWDHVVYYIKISKYVFICWVNKRLVRISILTVRCDVIPGRLVGKCGD